MLIELFFYFIIRWPPFAQTYMPTATTLVTYSMPWHEQYVWWHDLASCGRILLNSSPVYKYIKVVISQVTGMLSSFQPQRVSSTWEQFSLLIHHFHRNLYWIWNWKLKIFCLNKTGSTPTLMSATYCTKSALRNLMYTRQYKITNMIQMSTFHKTLPNLKLYDL